MRCDACSSGAKTPTVRAARRAGTHNWRGHRERLGDVTPVRKFVTHRARRSLSAGRFARRGHRVSPCATRDPRNASCSRPSDRWGDVNPYVAIALELKARGHHPLIATTPIYREKIEALRLGFYPVRPELPSHDQPEVLAPLIERLTHPRRGGRDPRTAHPAHLREIYEDLSAAVLGTNLLVIHPLPLVGPIVAEACGVPWISSVLSPFSLFSAFDPPVGPRMPYLHRLLRLHPRLGRLFVWLAKRLTAPFVRPVYRLRADLGLPTGGHPLIEG
jgi:hypothetical protein